MITKESGIMETVTQYPQTIKIFGDFGMGCIGCAAAHFETIEEGANAHGIDVAGLIEALNSAVA